MALRVTIMLDEDIARKVRHKQASIIKRSGKGVSFSRVINNILDGKIKL